MLQQARRRVFDRSNLTPVEAYRALVRSGHGAILESAPLGGSVAQHSLIGFDYADARIWDGTANMIDSVRRFVGAWSPLHVPEPFGGGAILAFAYDAARPFAGLAERTRDSAAFPAAYVAIPATWCIFDHIAESVAILGFAHPGRDVEQTRRRVAECHARLGQNTRSPKFEFEVGPVRTSLSEASFLRAVRRVKEYIADGSVYQLQLGIRYDAPFFGDPLTLYERVRSRNPSPYMFFINTPFGAALGASPEFLVRLSGRTALLRPLAGTRPRGADQRTDAAYATELANDEKEIAEHLMLVDLGRNDLGSVCDFGGVRVDDLMKIERYSHVMHLASTITGTLREGLDGLDLFRATFPAGTVTGTPKVRAMQLIDGLEPVARNFYAGSIGLLHFDGTFDSCIALRGAFVREDRIHWQASAGIVADSVPEREHAEVVQKAAILREALRCA